MKLPKQGCRFYLIVRGMCCLRPNIKGVSQNIRAIGIVGQRCAQKSLMERALRADEMA